MATAEARELPTVEEGAVREQASEESIGPRVENSHCGCAREWKSQSWKHSLYQHRLFLQVN